MGLASTFPEPFQRSLAGLAVGVVLSGVPLWVGVFHSLDYQVNQPGRVTGYVFCVCVVLGAALAGLFELKKITTLRVAQTTHFATM
jgi:hypothetical protein